MRTRRNFIISIFRIISLAIIASVSGYLLIRDESDEICNFDFVCKNCKNLKACNLPEAKDARREYEDGRREVENYFGNFNF